MTKFLTQSILSQKYPRWLCFGEAFQNAPHCFLDGEPAQYHKKFFIKVPSTANLNLKTSLITCIMQIKRVQAYTFRDHLSTNSGHHHNEVILKKICIYKRGEVKNLDSRKSIKKKTRQAYLFFNSNFINLQNYNSIVRGCKNDPPFFLSLSCFSSILFQLGPIFSAFTFFFLW